MVVVGSDSGGGTLVVVIFITESIYPDDPPDDHGSDRCPARGVYAWHLPYMKSRVCQDSHY